MNVEEGGWDELERTIPIHLLRSFIPPFRLVVAASAPDIRCIIESATTTVFGLFTQPQPLMQSAPKRRRLERSPSPVYKLDDEDDSYEPYIPVAKRRELKLAKLTARGANAEKDKEKAIQEEIDEREDEEREEERRREKARKERTLLMEAQEVHDKKAAEGSHSTTLLACWLPMP